MAIVALVVLRLGVGWQFFREGAEKIQDPKPFSAYFLANAKGPLTPVFHGMIWDAHGLSRLDRGETAKQWEHYRNRVGSHYGFTDDQNKQADRILDRYEKQLKVFFADNGDDIKEYKLQIERHRRDTNRDIASTAPMREVASLAGQVKDREMELRATAAPWLGKIDAMWAGLEGDMNELASGTQTGRGTFALEKPGRKLLDSIFVDKVIRWFDITVGALLILGLFTRTTSIVAAAFLLSVVASQWPPTTGPMSTYYQLNLALALVVLAATGAGRLAGLDFFLTRLRNWCCPPKQGSDA